MRKSLLSLLLLFSAILSVSAQDSTAERRMVYPSMPFFVPHWYVKAQGGAAYDIGEAKFSQLVSPALQLSLGYKFNEFIGVRGSLSGLWARNRYAYPEAKYSWNFIQPAVEAEFDLTNLFWGFDPERKTSLYAFVGGGVAFSFNNDDAVKDTRWNPVVRAGLGVDYNITDEIAIGAEVNANMLPDHFNSKIGRHDNRDWHFNALVGVKFTLGKSYGYTHALYEDIVQPITQPEPQPQFVDVPIEKISFNVNIQFLINQSVIRANQIPKLQRLLTYLNEHPRAFIRLSGYADKDTGTPEINMRLSQERAQVVSQYLMDAGIEEWRIRRFAKGDRVQPFDIPEDNRVCICFVYDPDHPEPMPF